MAGYPDYSYFFGNGTMIPNFGMFLEQAMNPHKDAVLRVPFYMTSSYRRNNGIKGVAMQINPSSVSFRQNKRISERDTQEGKIFFHWTSATGMNNDVLRIEFTGQTGNINIRTGTRGKGFFGTSESASAFGSWLSDTVSDLSGEGNQDSTGLRAWGANVDTSGASKLVNFHNLWALTREPVLDVSTGLPIKYYITYASPLFGNSLITFIGHFSRPLEITDDANDPFNKRYSFGFTAVGSIPSPAQLYPIIMRDLSNVFMNAISG